MRSFCIQKRSPWPEWHKTPRFLDNALQPSVFDFASGYALNAGSHVLDVQSWGWVLCDMELTFVDDGGFLGGWDGAKGDPYTVQGPLVVDVDGATHYLYRTDHRALGTIRFEVER